MAFFWTHSLALSLFCLLPSFISSAPTSDPSAIVLIRNNINLYSILQDTKNFVALDQVFTPDATPAGLAGPNAPYPQNLTGIELFLAAFLDDATTLHYSDTQYVTVDESGTTATAISYAQAVYFAKDVNVSGQICTYYETFTDDFVLLGGTWLSRNKTLDITAIVGNTSVVLASQKGV